MRAAVVEHGVRERRRGVLGYGVGLGLMVLWVMAIYPSVEAELVDYVDAMPEAMKSLFGMDDIASLPGFVHAEVFSLMGPIVFLALAITSGAATVAGEERERILPVVLATGIGRGDLVLSKWVSLVLQLAALGVLTWLSLLVGLVAAGGGISIGALTAATFQLTLLGLLFGTLALAAGAATGNRALAAGVAVGAALATYLMDALANLVGWLEPFEVLSPFHWYAPGNPLLVGWSPGWSALLVVVTVAVVAVAVVAFDRRDVGV